MSFSTSPYQNNDYQAASSYRPYRLPVNDAFMALAAQNQFWDAGAQKIKQRYDNALELKLRTTENKEVRDNFIKDSEKAIQKISSMNVADPTVQRQGLNIFSPLFKDQDIVGEDYVVREMEKEFSIGEGFRSRDNGKHYNPVSIENMQFEQSLLSGPLNKRDGWKSLYNNFSKYTPHVDVTKELETIQSVVKAEEIQKAQLKGDNWYIEEITTKGVSKDRILGAIEEMGSPQLKAQMRAEGRNTYYKKLQQDPTSVDGYFQTLAHGYYNTKLTEVKNKKAEVEYEAYMTPNKPEYSSKRDALNKTVAELSKTIDKIEKEDMPKFVGSFAGLGSFDNFGANLSKVEQLWQASSMNNLASKLKYENYKQELKANPAKIAQENINVAYERINQDDRQLAETKRHNLVNEKIDWFNALKPPKGDGSSDGTTDPLLNGTNSNVAVNYPTPAQENTAEYGKLAEEQRNALFNESDEALRQVAISNIIGEPAWAGIQQNLEGNKTVAQALPIESELNKAVDFVKAYSDKYIIQTAEGSFAKTMDREAIKAKLSKMSVRTFKQMMGDLVKSDNGFTSDLIGKMYTENGEEKAANFRAKYNETLRNQMNISKVISKKVGESLGEYGKYFDNGNVPLTDANITNVYNKAVKEGAKVYVKTVIEHPYSNPNITETKQVIVSEQEYNDYKSGKVKLYSGSIEPVRPTLSQFKEQVRKKTDHVFYNLAVENNQAGTQTSYTDKDKALKSAIVGRFGTISPDVMGTDANPENKELYEFLRQNSDHLKLSEVRTPGAGQTLPSVRFTMEEFGGENDEDTKEKINKLNNTWFRVTDIPSKYFQKDNGSGAVRYTGAHIAYAPVKLPTGTAEISIINASRDAGSVIPEIAISGDLYIMKPDGTKRFITAEDVKSQFQATYNTTIEAYAGQNPAEVNRFLAAYVNNIEKLNRPK